MEPGETPQACLERELQEELGITTITGSIIAENTFSTGSKTIKLLAIAAEMVLGTITLHDHDKAEWVSKEDLLNYKLSPGDVLLA